MAAAPARTHNVSPARDVLRTLHERVRSRSRDRRERQHPHHASRPPLAALPPQYSAEDCKVFLELSLRDRNFPQAKDLQAQIYGNHETSAVGH